MFNNGDLARDFTYIDDAVEAVVRLIDKPPRPDAAAGAAPHRLVNIASGRRVALLEFIAALEKALDCRAEKILEAMQPGDVPETWADTSVLEELTGFTPRVAVAEGVERFGRWLRGYAESRDLREGHALPAKRNHFADTRKCAGSNSWSMFFSEGAPFPEHALSAQMPVPIGRSVSTSLRPPAFFCAHAQHLLCTSKFE